MPLSKLVLIDGHSLAYRAFCGLSLYDRGGKVHFTNAKGEFTNAVCGFCNMLLKVWADERPDGFAVAFDLGRTFRDDLYEPYKGTREKMPDELVPQIDRIVQLVQAFDIQAVSAEGYEADDVLGTLATRAAADGIDVVIVTATATPSSSSARACVCSPSAAPSPTRRSTTRRPSRRATAWSRASSSTSRR